jgi:hypothetical protein
MNSKSEGRDSSRPRSSKERSLLFMNNSEIRKVFGSSWPKNQKLWWVGAFGAAIGIAIAAFFLPGGDDLYRYYQPFAQGCLNCGFVPYFAQWVLWPLALLKYPLTWPIWTLFCLAGFMVLVRYTKVNPLLLFISFPMLGQFWLGQIDIIVCIGLVILLFSRNPYIRGLGIAFALAKPQLAGIPILFLVLLEQRRDLWKLFLIPLLIFAASLLVYGLQWPYQWLQNALLSVPVHVWRLASSASWPYGLIFLPAPLLFRDRRQRLLVSLLVSSIATPFFGVYSYVVFLLFELNWWTVILSYIWILAYPLFQANSMYFAFLLPLSLLFFTVLKELKNRSTYRKGMQNLDRSLGNEGRI